MKSTFKILAVLIAIIKNSELYVIDKYYITQNVPNDIKSIKLESIKLFDESSEKNQSTIENYKGMIVLKYLEGSTVELINESASLSISRLHLITGNVDENLLYYCQYFRISAGRNIPRILVSFYPERIIHGIRVHSLNDTGGKAQLTSGGANFYFARITLTGRKDHFLFKVEYFHNKTATKKNLFREYEVEHWGTVNSQSVLLSENRHYDYPTSMVLADRRITENPQKTIHAMRLYAKNGGRFELIEGGLGHDFVTSRFTGVSIGRGFDFRLELYENYGNSGSSKKASMILIILLYMAYWIRE